MNQLDSELAQLNSELRKNSTGGKKAKEDFEFFSTFNETANYNETVALIKKFRDKEKQLASPSARILQDPSSGFWGRIFGSKEREEQQKQLEAEDKRRKETISTEIKELEFQIKSKRSLMERFDSMDEYQLRAMIKMHECRDEIIQGKIQSVSAKRARLQQAIGPLLEDAERYRQQVRDCEDGLQACQRYTEQLAVYRDAPSRRRQVHEACAAQFNGNGRPSDVANDLKKKLDAARRQLDKIDGRIDEEIRKMEIVVKRAFIDGNNLCFKRQQYKDSFIGTKAVEAIATALLQSGMKVTVVFDPHIGKGKDSLSFDRVRQNFEKGIEVEQAPPETSADLVLMMMARDEFDCIISNDKFSDHGERSVVREKRVFRAIITDSLVSVPMLNLEVSIP